MQGFITSVWLSRKGNQHLRRMYVSISILYADKQTNADNTGLQASHNSVLDLCGKFVFKHIPDANFWLAWFHCNLHSSSLAPIE